MLSFALNHMTVARLSYAELQDLAAQLGSVGVEVRNDLPQPLFDGLDPATAGALARDKGLRLLAVAEVKRFNDWSDDKHSKALALMKIAGIDMADVVVVGVDATQDALVAMQAGDLDATVFRDAAGQGAGALNAALTLAKGEPVDQKVFIPFKLVTPANVDEFLSKN